MKRTGLCETCEFGKHCVLNDAAFVCECEEFCATEEAGE